MATCLETPSGLDDVCRLLDVFLTCSDDGSSATYYQIWLNTQGGFVFNSQVNLLPGTGQITFADMGKSRISSLFIPAKCSVGF
jgi:hypothetical protein